MGTSSYICTENLVRPLAERVEVMQVKTVIDLQSAVIILKIVLIIKTAILTSINDNNLIFYGFLRNIDAVISVNMAVYKVFRPICLQQPNKALKAPVGKGVEIVDMPCGSVGQ